MESAAFLVEVSEEQIRRERQKARELRASPWWQRKRGAGVCHHCGERFPPNELTMDHLVPIVRGGKSTKGNLVASCKKCNSERKHRLPFERGGRIRLHLPDRSRFTNIAPPEDKNHGS